jgi:hypothetical protein
MEAGPPMICPTCATNVTRVDVSIDPRHAERLFVADCGHPLTIEQARNAYRQGLMPRPKIPEVCGATLFEAERARHFAEEGHTPESDADLVGSELAWACWALIDAALSGREVEQAPSVWPERLRGDWPTDKSSLRLLIIAGSMLCAEVDRRLAAGERP